MMCIANTIYGKTFEGGNFSGFSLNHKCFPKNMALSIGNVSLLTCYHESFPVNSNFPL